MLGSRSPYNWKSLSLNLKDHLAAQDMIRIVMKEKKLSAKEAIESSVNLKLF